MHHERETRPITVIRPRKLPAIAATAMLAVPIVALIILRRDAVVYMGEACWFVVVSILALATAASAIRLISPEALMRVTPEGIALPHVLSAPIHWSDIARIQTGTRRSRTGDIHDRLIIHFRQPQTVDWQSAKLRRLLGDAPQAAIPVIIGFAWPLRADDVRDVIQNAARAYAGAKENHSAAAPMRRRVFVKAAILLAAITIPVAAYFADTGLPRQFSTALNLYHAGDIERAVPLLESDARAGDREAAHILGVIYLNGDGVTRNPAMAAGWFARAADAGHPDAAYNLGNAYRLGLGTPQNIAAAVEWYTRAAASGSPEAAYTLGTVYRLGDGVRRDYTAALHWLNTAAERDYAPAAHDLGRLYQEGIAVPRDLLAAERWYTRAAQHEYAPARYDLARLLLDGNLQQRGIGFKYLIQAADGGFAPAQRRLAAILFNAQGVERDPIAAYKWISLAERSWPAQTRADLVREKARIAAALTGTDLENAKSQIRNWRPARVTP